MCPLVAEEEVAAAVACQGVVAVVAYQVVPSACHLHPSSAVVPVVDTVAAVLVSRIALVVLPGFVVEHQPQLACCRGCRLVAAVVVEAAAAAAVADIQARRVVTHSSDSCYQAVEAVAAVAAAVVAGKVHHIAQEDIPHPQASVAGTVAAVGVAVVVAVVVEVVAVVVEVDAVVAGAVPGSLMEVGCNPPGWLAGRHPSGW